MSVRTAGRVRDSDDCELMQGEGVSKRDLKKGGLRAYTYPYQFVVAEGIISVCT